MPIVKKNETDFIAEIKEKFPSVELKDAYDSIKGYRQEVYLEETESDNYWAWLIAFGWLELSLTGQLMLIDKDQKEKLHNYINLANRLIKLKAENMKLLKWLFGSRKPALNKPVVSGQVLKNPRLRYRKNGDVDYDPDSREPSFVQYNNAREIIRQAKLRGERFPKIQLSNASEEALRYDGYKIEYRNAKDGDGEYDKVRW